MTLYTLAVVMGFSILIPAIIGAIRYRQMEPAYRPFLYFIWYDLFNHILSILLDHYFHSNAINSNIAVLVECVFFLFLFRSWGIWQKHPGRFITLLVSLVLLWVIDNCWWHTLRTTNSFFRILYAATLIVLCIEQINKLIVKERNRLVNNASFVICTGLLIYCSYKAIMEVFYFMELKASDSFYINIFIIMVFVNCFVNLLYGWASLWIPRKRIFI